MNRLLPYDKTLHPRMDLQLYCDRLCARCAGERALWYLAEEARQRRQQHRIRTDFDLTRRVLLDLVANNPELTPWAE